MSTILVELYDALKEAGATILGSGAVGLILDVEALVQRAGGFGRAAKGETPHDLA